MREIDHNNINKVNFKGIQKTSNDGDNGFEKRRLPKQFTIQLRLTLGKTA